LHRLAGDLRNQLVVTVVVQNGDTFSFGHRRDQQVRQADCSDAPSPPHDGLDRKRAPPVLIMGGQPFIASITVGSYLIELRAAPSRPSELELDDTASSYHSRLDQRRQDRCHFRWRRRASALVSAR